MKLRPEEVHALAIIALDPRGEFVEMLLSSLEGRVREVADALAEETDIVLLDSEIRAAVSKIRNWADRRKPTPVLA